MKKFIFLLALMPNLCATPECIELRGCDYTEAKPSCFLSIRDTSHCGYFPATLWLESKDNIFNIKEFTQEELLLGIKAVKNITSLYDQTINLYDNTLNSFSSTHLPTTESVWPKSYLLEGVINGLMQALEALTEHNLLTLLRFADYFDIPVLIEATLPLAGKKLSSFDEKISHSFPPALVTKLRNEFEKAQRERTQSFWYQLAFS